MITVTIQSLENASGAQQAYAEAASNWLEDIVNRPEFADGVQHATYNPTLFRMDTGQDVPVTNDILWQCIAGGREWQQPFDAEIDLQARLEPMAANVLGGVTPPSSLIVTNTLFFNQWMNANDMLSLAAHWFHEWLHTAGVLHQSATADYNDAVYVLGYLVVRVGRGEVDKKFSDQVLNRSMLGKGYLDAYHNPAIGHG